MTSTLYQEGPRDAKIVICGESPGGTEVLLGRPFQGGAGLLLDSLLAESGLRREEIFLTNICHHQPPGNDFEWFLGEEQRHHLSDGLRQLRADLQAIQPKLVVALGNWPLWSLSLRYGISDWRGSVLRSTLHEGWVLATFHPAAALRTYEYKHLIRLDLERAKTLVQTDFAGVPPVRRLLSDGTPAERLGQATALLSAGELSVDIECTRSDQRLICVGFSSSPEEGLTLYWPEDHALIKALCESPSRKVLQNGTFDQLILAKHGIELRNFWWDTMLAYHAINPECAAGEDELKKKAGPPIAFGKGLDFLTSIYTLEPFYKKSGKTGDLGRIGESYQRAAIDSAVTLEIKRGEEGDLKELGTEGWFRETMRLVPVLAGMTTRGIPVDLEARSQMERELVQEVVDLQAQLDTTVGRHINVKSTSQNGDMQWLVYTHLGLPQILNKESGNPTTGKDAMAELSYKYDIPILNLAMAIRERRDILERYLRVPLDSDGRMRCSWDMAGTVTGRLASRETAWGTGTNLQNQPEKLRKIFTAPPGQVILYADYSQAEARVVAYLACCRSLIDLFEDPKRHVHKENAMRIFGATSFEEVTESQYFLAKKAIHSGNYMISAPELTMHINTAAVDTWGRKGTGIRVTIPETQALLDAYFGLYPEIPGVFWEGVRQQLKRGMRLTTPFGRTRTFHGRWTNKLVKEAVADIPQSTIGQLTRIALRRVGEEGAPFGLSPFVQVHDSIGAFCPEDRVEQGVEALKTFMAIPIPINGMTLRVPVDVKVGKNWGNADENNPNGLRKV